MTENQMNLLMVGSDTSVMEGLDSTLYRMEAYFSQHWNRIDIIMPHTANPQRLHVYDNIYFYPSRWPSKLLQPLHIVRTGRRLLAERDYDLIVTHDFGFFYNGIGTWLMTRGKHVPYVSEIHHIEGYPRAVTRKERLYRALAMIYLRLVWRSAAGIRVVNQTELPALLHRLGVPDEKILYLSSLYLDFDVFHPMPDVEKRYDVVFVGRLTANKGLFTILDAVNIARRTHPDLTVCLLGRGPLQDAITSRVAALGLENTVTLVERLPRAEDVAAFYNQARMLVCASTAEGGPRVTVEAMACGTPVISTPVGVVPDVITDGENGLLFHWQAGELADKITRLLDDESLQVRLGEAGRLTVQSFQAESVIARYAQGFQELARRAKQQQ